jgi:hypothetical protein
MIIRPKHISVRNPQAPGPRSRSALCSRRRRYDARRSPIFAGHLHSGVLCIQCRQARGGIPLVATLCSRLHARATDFHFENRGMLLLVNSFLFRPHRGVSGNTEAGWRQWRQTRFGHARSERSRPQFTAHNSVRSLKNGLSLGGSSATRPTRVSRSMPTRLNATHRSPHVTYVRAPTISGSPKHSSPSASHNKK